MTHSEDEVKAPEGGWGYVICIALIVNFICCFGHLNSFAMLYNDFFVGLGEGTRAITLVKGVTAIVMSFSGVLTNVALKKFSLRQVGLFGAALYTLSWFLNFFTAALYQMVISSGVLGGMGIIIITTVTFANFNTYFVEKRVMVLSICQMVVGLGTMFYPLLIDLLLEQYGYRGTVLVLSALIANTILAVLCLQPVEWHTKPKYLYTEISADDLITKIEKSSAIFQVSTVKINDSEQDSGQFEPSKQNVTASRKSSLTPQRHEKEEEPEMGKWSAVVKFLDISLLGDLVYLNITIGINFSLFSDYGFFLMYPLFLYSMNFTTAQVASFLTLVSAADLLSRALMAVVSKFHQFPSRNIFFISVIGAAVSKILFLQCNSYWSFVATTFLMGLFRGPMTLAVPLVYAEYAPERFAAAYGLSILFLGGINTFMFPSLGYIRDYSGSFTVAFCVCILLLLICIIPWSYEYWYFKRNKSNIKK